MMGRRRSALLVVDMLRDFITGPFAAPGGERLVFRVRRVLDRARARNMPVFFVCDAHAPDDAEFAVMPPHAVDGSAGAEIVDDLAPRAGEMVVKKRRYSGFYETRLADGLGELDVGTLALCGLQTDCCVMHTAADGFYRGFEIVILEDAVAARTEEGHRRALAEMKRLYGARIQASDAFPDLSSAAR